MENQIFPQFAEPARSATPALPAGDDHTEKYVTREDLDRMKDELLEAMSNAVPAPPTAKKGGTKNEPAV